MELIKRKKMEHDQNYYNKKFAQVFRILICLDGIGLLYCGLFRYLKGDFGMMLLLICMATFGFFAGFIACYLEEEIEKESKQRKLSFFS